MNRARHAFDPETAALTHLADLPGEAASRRANDAAISRGGHLVIGIVEIEPADRAKPTGSLHRFDGPDVVQVMDGIWMQNGTAFSPNDRTIYLAETAPDVQTV